MTDRPKDTDDAVRYPDAWCGHVLDRPEPDLEMKMKLKVYTASKLDCAPIWRALRDDHPEIDIVARWPFLHVGSKGDPEWPSDCAAHGSIFWQHDFEDVARCDVVLVYGAETPVLRGALVEAGMGIALGKIVIVVGDNPSYGTWQYHTQCRRVASMGAALSLMRLIASGLPQGTPTNG